MQLARMRPARPALPATRKWSRARTRILLPVLGTALVVLASCGHEEPAESARIPTEPATPIAWPDDGDAFDAANALPGRWRPAAADARDADADADADPDTDTTPAGEAQRARAEELATLGYLSGTRPPSAGDGVVALDPARVQPGLDLVVSGHAPEAVLMRNDGSVLHTWRCTAGQAFPGREGTDNPTVQCWRRARLFPDGRLLAIFEGFGLVCLDADSRVLWAFPGMAHHDLDLAPSGHVLVLVRDVHVLPRIDPDQPVAEGWICELSPEDGKLVTAVSLLQCLEAGVGYRATRAMVQETSGATTGDLFHTNTLEVIAPSAAGVSPRFRPGDVLVSMRNLDRIGVVDMQAKRFRWTLTGPFRAQHDPSLLPDGRVLMFDNQGLGMGRSRAIEIDPSNSEILWSWSGSDEDPLWSATCGAVQRLANGNTLVVESDGGRAFEVTREGVVVWRWNSPYRAGDGGRYVATLFDLVRLPADFPFDWLGEDRPR